MREVTRDFLAAFLVVGSYAAIIVLVFLLAYYWVIP